MLIYTIKELCRTCYKCVRECLAKAIWIEGGQAEVIVERCIACGNCTKVCSQGAKVILNTTDRVLNLLAGESEVATIIEPSFPAEFSDIADHRLLVGMIRSLGVELREILEQHGISGTNSQISDFDSPVGSRVNDDAITGNIIAAEGRIDFQIAFKEFEAGLIKNQHMELPCCEGCIMGPGLSKNGKQYNRRMRVSAYASEKMRKHKNAEWQKAVSEYSQLDLSIRHKAEDQRFDTIPEEKEVNEVLISMGKKTKKISSIAAPVDTRAVSNMLLPFARDWLKQKCVFHIPLKNCINP